MTVCPVTACDRPTHPGWAICRPCSAQLHDALDGIPALQLDLDTTLAGLNGQGGGGSTNAETPLPFDYRASEAGWVLRNTLVGWVRDLEPDHTGHPAHTTPAMAAWLVERFGALLVHPAAGEVVEEITAAVAAGWRAVDIPAERVFLGRCPQCHLADVHAAPGALEVTCRECGATHGVEALRSALRAALDDHLVTAVEYAGMLVTLGTGHEATVHLVDGWAARGRLVVHAGATYRFGELQCRMAERMQWP